MATQTHGVINAWRPVHTATRRNTKFKTHMNTGGSNEKNNSRFKAQWGYTLSCHKVKGYQPSAWNSDTFHLKATAGMSSLNETKHCQICRKNFKLRKGGFIKHLRVCKEKRVKKDALERTIGYAASTQRLTPEEESDISLDSDTDEGPSQATRQITGKGMPQRVSNDSSKGNITTFMPTLDPEINTSVKIPHLRQQTSFTRPPTQLATPSGLTGSTLPLPGNPQPTRSTYEVPLEQNDHLSYHPKVLTVSNTSSFEPKLLPAIRLLNQKANNLHRNLDEMRARMLLKNWRAIPNERRQESSVRNRDLLKGSIKEHAMYFLGIRHGESPNQWPVPNPTSVQEINKSQRLMDHVPLGDRPNEKLSLDWANSGLTNWTKYVAAAFVADFLSENREKSFSLKEDPDLGEILRIFIRFVLHLKAVFVKRPNGSPISNVDEYAKKRARKRSRRRQILKLRVSIVSQYEIPGQALKALHLLGIDGMSSEESEGEVGQKDRQYRVKKVPWRSSAITHWLHSIDQLPLDERYKRSRIPSDLQSDRCTPPSHLPLSFYNWDWLESRSPLFRDTLDITEETIDLPDLAPYISLLHRNAPDLAFSDGGS